MRPVPPILVIPMPMLLPLPVIVLPAKEKPEEGKEFKALRARETKRAARKKIKRFKARLRQENIQSVFRNE